MDRAGDVVDLLVEHATDFRMCDLLDESIAPGSGGPGGGGASSGPRKSGGDGVGLGLVPGKSSIMKQNKKNGAGCVVLELRKMNYLSDGFSIKCTNSLTASDPSLY